MCMRVCFPIFLLFEFEFEQHTFVLVLVLVLALAFALFSPLLCPSCSASCMRFGVTRLCKRCARKMRYFFALVRFKSWKLCSVGVCLSEKLSLSTYKPIRGISKKREKTLNVFHSYGSFARFIVGVVAASAAAAAAVATVVSFVAYAAYIVHDIFWVCPSVEIRAPIDSHANIDRASRKFRVLLCVSFLYLKYPIQNL